MPMMMPTMEIVPVLVGLAAAAQSQQAQPPETASADRAPPPAAAPPPHGSPSGGNVFLTVFLTLVAGLAFAYLLVRLFRSVRWRPRVHGRGQARVGDLEAAAPKHAGVRQELKAKAAAGAGPPEQLVKMKQVIGVRVIVVGLPRD